MVLVAILKKKLHFLYFVETPESQLSFAISLEHLLDPKLTNREADRCNRQIVTMVDLKYRRPLYENSVCILQNVKGFDSYILLNTMVELGLKPSIIMSFASKIRTMVKST